MSTDSGETELLKVTKQGAILRSQISTTISEIESITATIRENVATKKDADSKIATLREIYKKNCDSKTNSVPERLNLKLLFEYDLISSEYELIKSTDANELNQKFADILLKKINQLKPIVQRSIQQVSVTHTEVMRIRDEILINVLRCSKAVYLHEILQSKLNDKSYLAKALDLKLVKIMGLTKQINDFNNLRLNSFGETHKNVLSTLDQQSTSTQSPSPFNPSFASPIQNQLKRDTTSMTPAATANINGGSEKKKSKLPPNTIWMGEAESAFQECLTKYYHRSNRNSLMSKYITKKCGKTFTNPQISDHIRRLKNKMILNIPTIEESQNYILDGDVLNQIEPDEGANAQLNKGNDDIHIIGASANSSGEGLINNQIESLSTTTTKTNDKPKKIKSRTNTIWKKKAQKAFHESFIKYYHLPNRDSLIAIYITKKTGEYFSMPQITLYIEELQQKITLKIPSVEESENYVLDGDILIPHSESESESESEYEYEDANSNTRGILT